MDTYQEIAEAVKSPLKSVQKNCPLILAALEEQKIALPKVFIAALATIAVETAHTFEPIREFGSDAYLTKMYDHREDLGNRTGDGVRYCGRGFIQITGRDNYAKYGSRISTDLIGNPDLALDPENAAKILALYFVDHHILVAAAQDDWTKIRKLVNGGTNGLQDFLDCVKRLEAIQN